MVNKIKNIWDFIGRNSVWFLLLAFSLLYIFTQTAFIKEITNTVITIILLEGLALCLSGIAVYSFTSFRLTETLFKGDDKEFSIMERGFALLWAGLVFLAVHILIGLVIFAIYLSQFAGA